MLSISFTYLARNACKINDLPKSQAFVSLWLHKGHRKIRKPISCSRSCFIKALLLPRAKYSPPLSQSPFCLPEMEGERIRDNNKRIPLAWLRATEMELLLCSSCHKKANNVLLYYWLRIYYSY